MAQTDNPFLDGMAKAFTDAAGMAQSVRAEIDTFVRQRLERLVVDMDFVPREEFEAVKAMAAKACAENEALAARLRCLEEAAALESQIRHLEARSDLLTQDLADALPKLGNLFPCAGDVRTLVTYGFPQNLVPVWTPQLLQFSSRKHLELLL